MTIGIGDTSDLLTELLRESKEIDCFKLLIQAAGRAQVRRH
jgi:hypothetical protein